MLGIYSYLEAGRDRVRRRLVRISGEGERPGTVRGSRVEPLAPITQRLVLPPLRKAAGIIAGFTPQRIRLSLAKSLESSGRPGDIDFTGYLVSKMLAAIISFSVTLFLSFSMHLPSQKAFVVWMCGLIAGFMIPDIVIRRRRLAWEKEIRKALPEILDLLTVSMEAGLGFDSAVAKVIEKRSGPLSTELGVLLQEIRVGRPRREALRALAERTRIQEISILVAAIIQAEQLGVGIANTLRVQATQLRLARRQRAEEAAMKAPVKMLFPLVFFIFPTIFIVLLGPAAIQVITTFVMLGK
ncbi:MAG TPA: type II secretion system F family protein [Firmicutes bacterium]|nr:type II secretion system F family protein [Bacillota bacterium]